MRTKFTFILLIIFLCIGFTSCGTYVRVKTEPNKVKKIPPGQAKKMFGSKSAKPFAPGQHK